MGGGNDDEGEEDDENVVLIEDEDDDDEDDDDDDEGDFDGMNFIHIILCSYWNIITPVIFFLQNKFSKEEFCSFFKENIYQIIFSAKKNFMKYYFINFE